MNWLREWLGINELAEAILILIAKQKSDYAELMEAVADLQAQIAETNLVLYEHDHTEPPATSEGIEAWAIQKYVDPKLTSFEHGIVLAKFVKGDNQVTQLRLPYWNNGKDKPPVMEPPSPSSGKRVPLHDGAVFYAYRKPFQGDGAVFVELCDPAGYAIEFKWVDWLTPSTTGKLP